MLASYLIKAIWVKFVGGGYLLWISIYNLFKKSKKQKEVKQTQASFWKVVCIIELTDIAFAVDSILAAVALSSKLWVVITGGLIGMIFMRFSAGIFIKLLDKFPRFEKTAYVLVFLIGLKIIIDGFKLPSVDFHDASNIYFWVFWFSMFLTILYSFKKPSKSK